MTDIPLPQSDLDALMSEDPLSLSDKDIDTIIAIQRNFRANKEAGIKPKREKGPGLKIDLKALGLVKDKPKVISPVGSGLRRI
jgi:hypothetical protein